MHNHSSACSRYTLYYFTEINHIEQHPRENVGKASVFQDNCLPLTNLVRDFNYGTLVDLVHDCNCGPLVDLVHHFNCFPHMDLLHNCNCGTLTDLVHDFNCIPFITLVHYYNCGLLMDLARDCNCGTHINLIYDLHSLFLTFANLRIAIYLNTIHPEETRLSEAMTLRYSF